MLQGWGADARPLSPAPDMSILQAVTYLLVSWKHLHPDEPVVLYSELDEERMERRKIEIFPDGRWGFADEQEEVGGTMLGVAPTPSVEQLNDDPEFKAEEIDKADFEKLWAVRRNARIMTAFPLENDGGGSS
jgi:hypothetical protein